MSYMNVYGIKKDVVDVLRDYLYPRQTIGTTFYTGMSINTEYAQSFIPFSTSMNSVSIYCNTVGTGLDDLTISVQTDTDNSPSGTKVKTITFSQSEITNDDWDTKECSYSNLISKNKYWLVFECSNQDSSNYYKIGRDAVMVNYQIGIPKSSTNSTWDSEDYDIMFNINIPQWIYTHYPSDTVQVNDLPRIAVDIVDRRVEERYCAHGLALANITGLVVIYSQYPDELDKILSYGERGQFIERGDLDNINLLTPGAISPIDRIRERMYIRSYNFNLRKKLKYISSEVPTVE